MKVRELVNIMENAMPFAIKHKGEVIKFDDKYELFTGSDLMEKTIEEIWYSPDLYRCIVIVLEWE